VNVATLALSEEKTAIWFENLGFRGEGCQQVEHVACALRRETRLMLADGSEVLMVPGVATRVRIVRDEPRLRLVRETGDES
jgi:hypothetical protein